MASKTHECHHPGCSRKAAANQELCQRHQAAMVAFLRDEAQTFGWAA
jgi:hypothetical protein